MFVVVLIFIALPLAELYVIIRVGDAIGVLPTLTLVVIGGVVGATLARSQGRAVWIRFNEALSQGKAPAREVFDGGLVVLGGALLLSPGFITDAVGIMLLVPPGRGLIRAIIRRAAARTPQGRPVFYVYDRFGSPGAGQRGPGGTEGQDPRAGGSGPGARQGASPPPGSSPWDDPSRGRSQSYDVEGSAREIGEEQFELPPGDEDD